MAPNRTTSRAGIAQAAASAMASAASGTLRSGARALRPVAIAVLLFAPVLTDCRGDAGRAGTESAAAPADTAGAARAATQPDTTTWAGWMLAELSQLREQVTYQEWVRTHLDEGPWGQTFGTLGCARRANRWDYPGDIAVERSADFYVPKPAATLPPLPPSTDSALAQCVLGRIEVRVTFGGSEGRTPSRAAADSLRRAVTRRYGPGTTDSTRLSAGWLLESRWEVGPSVLVVRERPELQQVVEAYLPSVPAFEASERWGLPVAELLEYVWYFARTAGIDSAQAAVPLAVLRAAEGSGELRGARAERRIVATLQPWLGAARTLDPTRRAAALVVADAILAYWACDIERAGALGPLEALGAQFRYQRESGEGVEAHCLYTGNWLAEALALDSLRAFSDSGRAMLLVSGLVRGGRGACGLDPPWVVSEGERLVQSITDRSLLTELHFVLGDALDESSPRDEIEPPLAHYRAGLALDSTSSRAREAWHRAWWILVHGHRSGPRSDLVWC